MALVRVTLGGKRLGYGRNNKAGSTTIINYLGQLLWNEKPTNYSGTNIQDFCGKDSYIGREKGFESYHKELKECEESFPQRETKGVDFDRFELLWECDKNVCSKYFSMKDDLLRHQILLLNDKLSEVDSMMNKLQTNWLTKGAFK